MKNVTKILFVLSAFVLPGSIQAGNSDVEIHCVPRKVSEDTKKASGEARMAKDLYGQPVIATGGGANRTKENWVYDVTIESKMFKDMANVEIKYVIFFTQEHLGRKEAAQSQRQTGSTALPSLRAHEKKSFSTDAVELKKSNLAGNFVYANGAKPNARDTLTGVWVRVYLNGQQFAEYANPSTLMREKWE